MARQLLTSSPYSASEVIADDGRFKDSTAWVAQPALMVTGLMVTGLMVRGLMVTGIPVIHA